MRGPQGVQVSRRRGFAAILLGRRVALGADHGAALPDLERAGDAEIHQLHIAIRVDHDVGRLHVAEDDRIRLVRMQERQHVAQLNGPGQNLLLRQEAIRVADDGFQILAVDEFQHQVGTVILGEVVVDARDGGVGQRGQQVGLALEIQHDGLPHERIGRDVDHLLDRHQLGDIREVQIAGPVDRAHAADADHFLDGSSGLRARLQTAAAAA